MAEIKYAFSWEPSDTALRDSLIKKSETVQSALVKNGKDIWHLELGETERVKRVQRLGQLFDIRVNGHHWANVMKDGSVYYEHDHGKTKWTMIWFLTDGGELWLDGGVIKISPMPGLVVMFPGNVRHSVPNNNKTRVNVVVNVP